VPQHVNTRGGDPRAMTRSVEQRNTELILQFADAAGDRRLRKAQLARCAAEAPKLRDPEQGFELVEARPHDPKNLSLLMEIF
jgi:hypothetical protein